METRERQPQQRPAATPESGASSHEELRQRARDLLRAGDDIIERALSGNSDVFLSSRVQSGGQ